MNNTTGNSQYYLGYEEDYFPNKKGGKYKGEYFLRDKSGNLIYKGTNHDEWYDFKEEWKSQQQSNNNDSDNSDKPIVDELPEVEFEDTDIYSPSNAGTPIENPNIRADVNDGNDIDKLNFNAKYTNPNGGGGNDKYFGTGGVNTYEFNPLLNAKPEIYQKHTDDNGKINWQAVAGENDNYHDHWVDSIGKDTIMNFSGAGGDGDKITIEGHTVAVTVLEETDNQVKLGLYSDQGADGSRGNGAHDFDVLGKIIVNHDGNFNYGSDVSVNANVFDGAFEYA